jgi:serine protease AprX
MAKHTSGDKPQRRGSRRPSALARDNQPHTEREQGETRKLSFVPQTLDRTVIAIPLLNELEEEKRHPVSPPKLYAVIIDLNLEYPGGRDQARKWVTTTAREIISQPGFNNPHPQGINEEKSMLSEQYLFAKLEGDVIRELVRQDTERNAEPRSGTIGAVAGSRAIYHIWPDFPIRPLTYRSLSTVKADAARASFAAYGEGIVWAVMDSGIDRAHPHFKLHRNLELEPPLEHVDFTGDGNATQDLYGHGTHVAGIIAGEMKASAPGRKKTQSIQAFVRNRNEHDQITFSAVKLDAISGMAPKCKLVSLRVLDEEGQGDVSSLIAAIARIQEMNGYGRRLLIHGVNISVGNDFEPEWFACGQSPLCVEVDRLVNSGVVVVVAAGNSGYGSLRSEYTGVVSAGLALTVNDPGNADLAITVGSTHREMPHIYGVSYFSSKGPTGDGRAKPDLVAPGEKIISCAAGMKRTEAERNGGACGYIEDSGTSMAAPHVSGVIAAFLSVRREFIGQPKKVKEIFLSTATDLRREKYFQGCGLVDLMRAIQSV